jgi:hypothetical protein
MQKIACQSYIEAIRTGALARARRPAFSVLREFTPFMRTIALKKPWGWPMIGELQHFLFNLHSASLII